MDQLRQKLNVSPTDGAPALFVINVFPRVWRMGTRLWRRDMKYKLFVWKLRYADIKGKMAQLHAAAAAAHHSSGENDSHNWHCCPRNFLQKLSQHGGVFGIRHTNAHKTQIYFTWSTLDDKWIFIKWHNLTFLWPKCNLKHSLRFNFKALYDPH